MAVGFLFHSRDDFSRFATVQQAQEVCAASYANSECEYVNVSNEY